MEQWIDRELLAARLRSHDSVDFLHHDKEEQRRDRSAAKVNPENQGFVGTIFTEVAQNTS